MRERLEQAQRGVAGVAGVLARMVATRRASRRDLLEQVEQLKFMTRLLEETIGAGD